MSYADEGLLRRAFPVDSFGISRCGLCGFRERKPYQLACSPCYYGSLTAAERRKLHRLPRGEQAKWLLARKRGEAA